MSYELRKTKYFTLGREKMLSASSDEDGHLLKFNMFIL